MSIDLLRAAAENIHAKPELLRVKASILANGLEISRSAFEAYGPPFLEKRRAYGNPDPADVKGHAIPPELYLADSSLIAAVNVDHDSVLQLSFDGGAFNLSDAAGFAIPVTFPKRPAFYDWRLSTGERVAQVVTLYGGGSLAVFANGGCSLVDIGEACHFCSISPNRTSDHDFVSVVRPKQVEEALRVALSDQSTAISQVMLNGGNFADADKSFSYYVRLARHAQEAIRASGRRVDLHLIAFPPRDLRLLSELADLDVSIAMNMEVFDPDLFLRFCPGKHTVAGQVHIFEALRAATKVLGRGRVYSIIVGGLEPISTLAPGLKVLANEGITPVINILHTDPHTPLESFPRPSVKDIMEMGAILQDVYSEYSFKPFYEGCGRNSIDTEAAEGLFEHYQPDF